jgi:glycosyltransferase involved in cell wall biosynthesis
MSVDARRIPEIHVLSVIVPAYNEADTIEQVLDRVLALGDLIAEVIVVDDGSTDDTLEIARRVARRAPRVHVEALEHNSGKTAAVARGIEVASAEIVIIQDADQEYDPAEIPAVIDPILRGEADVVYGSRFLVRRAARVLYFYHFVANKLLTFLSNLLTNRNMTDIETCYKAMRSGVIKPLVLTSKGFGMEVEITALVSKTHARTYEVPISYHGRTYAEGKKIGVSDGLAAIGYILRYNLITPWLPRGRKYIKAVNRFLAGVSTPQLRVDPPIIPRPTVPSPHWPVEPAAKQPGRYSDVA